MNIDETENHEERQESEFQLLQSVYGNDVEDLRQNDVWKVRRPPEMLLKLKPQEGMSGKKEVNCCVELRVKIPPLYPDCVPELNLENSSGLSLENLGDLKKKMDDFCYSSIGEVMILDLSQLVQEFLHTHNIYHYNSVYEEMVKNQQKQEEKVAEEEERKKELKRRIEEHQIKQIEVEIARRREEELEEKRSRRIRKQEEDAVGKATYPDSTPLPGGNADPFDANTQTSVSELKFYGKQNRTVHRGECLGKGGSGSTVFAGMDASSGKLVAVHRWQIQCPSQNQMLTDSDRRKSDKYRKAINSIEQELQGLVKLRHLNLAPYLAMKSVQKDDVIEIDVLQEYVKGVSLEQRIVSSERIGLETIRAYTEQMLQALDYLHRRSVIHRDFKASSVFVGAGISLKVADYSIGKRLRDLNNESHITEPAVRFSEDQIPSRISKKGDVLRLGMVVLSLARGRIITDYPPVISTSSFPDTFHSFLDKCLVVEERLRFGTSHLLEHDFIKPEVAANNDHHAEEGQGDGHASSDGEEGELLASHVPETSHTSQLSRLHSEFEQLEWLGKGGYGAVVKVRNKLDDRYYAIKRILLNPSRSSFNKKITREVKLLSRLNHEHVVRYYNSWIETSLCIPEDSSDSSSGQTPWTSSSKPQSTVSTNSLGFKAVGCWREDDVEAMAPPPVLPSSSSEWNVSIEHVSWRRSHDVDDDDDEEDDMFETIYIEDSSSSESVMFDHDEDGEAEDDDDDENNGGRDEENKAAATSTTQTESCESTPSSLITKRFLYIQLKRQMEYCEKSTLRQTIEGGLCKDTERMWRLFREILEGLSHIHHQGMIHRDLKPQNIFLDQNDHVKIGDFGLATAHARELPGDPVENRGSNSDGGVGDSGTSTGVVGTALYVAPELVGRRTTYSQKVDIYSLGIIFFEMFYAGITTKMERVKVIGNLRLPMIVLPADFDEVELQREAEITRWCLNHEPNHRPTSDELLKCRLVPTPVLKESDVLGAMEEMMVDPHSKTYRLVVEQVFDQHEHPTTSLLYDIDTHKRTFSPELSGAQQQTFDAVRSVMQRYGAINITTPLLVPRHSHSSRDGDAATFMDTSGTIVDLPHNLRVPFARYVTLNEVTSVKRYTIERVFRARKIRRSRPKELWECSFDVVTHPGATCCLVPDAEVMALVADIVSHFPLLAARNYKIRINHMQLLEAVLKYCGCDATDFDQAFDALAFRDSLNKTQIEARLANLPLHGQHSASLPALVQTQGSLAKLHGALRSLLKSRSSPASSRARHAMGELDAVKKNLDALQFNLPLVFDLGFVVKHHRHYNGVIFQVSAAIEKKKRTAIDVLAVGGRYDKLMHSLSYLKLARVDHSNQTGGQELGEARISQPCAVGVSVAVEKVVAAALCEGEWKEWSDGAARSYAPVDVLVCGVGRSHMLAARLAAVKRLRDAHLRAETLYDNNSHSSVQDVLDKSQERGVRCVVLLNEKEADVTTVRIHTHETSGPKSCERKVPLDQLVSYLKRHLVSDEAPTSAASSSSERKSASVSSGGGGCGGGAATTSYDATTTPIPSQGSCTRQLTIDVVAPDKLAFNTKRRLEFEIRTKLAALPLLSYLSPKTKTAAIAVDMTSQAIKTMAMALEVNGTEDEFAASLARFVSTCSKHRKYVALIGERVSEAKFQHEVPVVILYNYKDHDYCVLA